MAEQVSRGKLLIVDDDKFITRLFGNMFANLYEVQTADSAENAIVLLRKGFIPGVILSDHLMPGMNGAEFLAETLKICPDSTRIIITGTTEPKEMIAIINQSKAFMYLTKPVEQIALVQAVRIGFQYHLNKRELKHLSHDYQAQNKKLEAEIAKLTNEVARQREISEKPKNDRTAIAKMLSVQIQKSEYFYFAPHSKTILAMCNVLAKDLKLALVDKATLGYAAQIHNLHLLNLDDEHKLLVPAKKHSSELNAYLYDNFKTTFENLALLPEMKQITDLNLRLYDYLDIKLNAGEEFSRKYNQEYQTLALTNKYHNYVYQLHHNQLAELREKGEITQTPEETLAKHNEFIENIESHTLGMDKLVVETFLDNVKFEKDGHFVPIKQELKIYKDPTIKRPEVVIQIIENGDASGDEIGTEDKIIIPKSTIVRLRVADLKVGMVVGQDVVTIRGSVLVQKGTAIDMKTLSKVRQLESTGLVDNNQSIVVITK